MGGYEPRDRTKHPDRATSGPSADDRFGAGPIGTNMQARIIGATVDARGTRITIARGKTHGVHVGMEGYVKAAGGMLSELQVDAVENTRCHAYVDVTLDQLANHHYAILNPTITPRMTLARDTHSRVLAVSVEAERTKITIARGSAHGVKPGTRGQLVATDGREGASFTIAGTTATQSMAYVAATVDHVQQYLHVILNPSASPTTTAPIQRRATDAAANGDVQSIAQAGVAGASERLPHFDTIQRAFGKHDLSGVQAQIGGPATAAAQQLGAQAYATGNQVAFASAPDLHTAAHEAAHAIQQRRGAVGFQGLGAADDEHERHADAVADAVVAGQSAEPLLDRVTGDKPGASPPTAEAAGAIQRKPNRDDSDRVRESAATFVPDLRTDDERARMYLGDTYPHRVQVANASEAPDGTEYAWSHTVKGPAFRPVGKPVLDGSQTYYPFVVRGVGDYRVVTKLRYGTANGVKQATQTAMHVVVDKPIRYDVDLETEKDGVRRPFAGNMLVGEDLIITTEFHELRRPDREPLEDVHAHVMVPGLEFRGVTALTNGVYEIRLHASRGGGALGTVAVLPYDTKLGDTPVHSIRADISKGDDEGNSDRRPRDFATAKRWLAIEFDYMFNEMRTGADMLSRQTQVNDPPPRQSIWMDILLGCVTAALGGAVAGISLAVAKHLAKGAGPAIEEGVKSFLEQSLATAATASFPKEQIGKTAPHVAFFGLQESAINEKRRDFQKHFANVLEPQLDAMERAERGVGFRQAMDLEGARKAERANIQRIQFDKSFAQWVKFVTKAQLNQRAHPTDAEGDTGTEMRKELAPGRRTAGVVTIRILAEGVKTPVRIESARMPGFNEDLRRKIGEYKVKDIPFALRVEGYTLVRRPVDWIFTFARNENREYWVNDAREYLAHKAGSSARDGAIKILEQEIGHERVVPEA